MSSSSPQPGRVDPIIFTSSPSSQPDYRKSSPEQPGRSPVKVLVDLSSDHGVISNAGEVALTLTGKKTAWNLQSNVAFKVGSVIDTVSWPALSELAKYSPKSASSDSLNPDVSGSIALSSSSKLTLNDHHSVSSQNPQSPSRQKSMNRGGVTGGSMTEASQLVSGKQIFPGSNKGLQNKNNNNMKNENDHGNKASGFSSQHTSRRGSVWIHQNSNRDIKMQQQNHQRGVRPFQRIPSVVPFIVPPPTLRHFPNHMGFQDFPSPVYYVAAPPVPETLRGVPFVPHPAPTPQVMFFPAPDPQRAMLLKQIEYYFSPENLCKDIFLRQSMDEKGWVPLSLIAGFNRVKQLTNNVQYILDTIQLSTVVEVQGEKIRKRNDWVTWLLPVDHSGSTSGLQSPITAGYEELEGKFRNVCLDLEDTPNNTGFGESAQKEVGLTRSASGNKIVTCQ